MLRARVKYYDYMGFEHDGFVIRTMPCKDELEDVVYCLIADINPQYNTHAYHDPELNKDVMYAEVRKSIECIKIGVQEYEV